MKRIEINNKWVRIAGDSMQLKEALKIIVDRIREEEDIVLLAWLHWYTQNKKILTIP